MTTDSPMPSPPFPSADNAVLRLIVGNAIASVQNGTASVEEAMSPRMGGGPGKGAHAWHRQQA